MNMENPSKLICPIHKIRMTIKYAEYPYKKDGSLFRITVYSCPKCLMRYSFSESLPAGYSFDLKDGGRVMNFHNAEKYTKPLLPSKTLNGSRKAVYFPGGQKVTVSKRPWEKCCNREMVTQFAYMCQATGKRNNFIYYECPECHKKYLSPETCQIDPSYFFIENIDTYHELVRSTNDTTIAGKQEQSMRGIDNNALSTQTVYVYDQLTNTCTTKKHNVVSLTAEIPVVNQNRNARINIFYCNDCKKYFVNQSALAELIRKKIYPAINFKVVSNAGTWNAYSELTLYGYNVRENGLSETERRDLLRWIIDSGLMSKQGIIRILDHDIAYNGKNPRNVQAKRKWEQDRDFVSKYVSGNKKVKNPKFTRA